MKKTISILTATLLVLFIVLSCKSKPGSENEKLEVNIACNLPLTGDLSTYGEAVKNGVILALSDLDKNLNKDSMSLNFDFQDNQGSPKTAVSILQNQLLNNPDIYVSGVQPQTMSIIEQVSAKKIPHFVWVYSPFICEKYPNTFRTWLNFKYEADHYIAYAQQYKPKKVAIFFVNLPITNTEFNDIVKPKLQEMGIKNIISESYSIEKTEFKDLAAKTKDFSPDLILLNGFKDQMINLIKTFRSYNLISNNGNTMCSFDLLDAAEELNNEQLDGLRVTAPYYVIHGNSEVIMAWKNRYHQKFNKNPLYTDAYAYDMTTAIYEALKHLKAPLSNEDITKALLNVNKDGITGPIKFTDKGDLILSLETCYYKDGKLIELK